MARQVVCAALVIASAADSPVLAFSAQLSRPWEPPLTTSTSLVRRRRRWDALQSTSAPTQDKDSDDTTEETPALHNDEEEDTMLLQKNEDLIPEIIIAHPLSHTMPVSSSDPPKTVEQPTVRSSLRLLFGMTRPSNFPGVVLLHILGTFLALQSPYVGNAQLLPTLARPSMMVVLFCLLLTSGASMVVCYTFCCLLNDVHYLFTKDLHLITGQ